MSDKYAPTPIGVVVRVSTSHYQRSDTYVSERTMRVMKSLSKTSSGFFEADCDEAWPWTDVVDLPKADGLFEVIIHPTSYDLDMPHVLDEWHYEFVPYKEDK